MNSELVGKYVINSPYMRERVKRRKAAASHSFRVVELSEASGRQTLWKKNETAAWK